MIPSNELRLGNYVISNPNGGAGTIIKIHTISESTVHGESLNGQLQNLRIDLDRWCDPIPLSPDILEKAGFAHQSNNEYVKDNFVFRIQQNDLILHGFEYDYNGVILKRPEYLHQLQNLYFALTGEELQINLNETK